MFAKKVKRKCNVRGCKNTDCFAVSRTREVGNTVIVCKSCLAEALDTVCEIPSQMKRNTRTLENAYIPPLFFNAKARGTGATETTADDTPAASLERTEADDTAPTDDMPAASVQAVTELCPVCGKVFTGEKGLKAHLRYCKPQTDNA